MTDISFSTAGGARVTRRQTNVEYADATSALIDQLDSRRGALFSSNYEYPGRYTRWDIGFVNPPLVVTARGRAMRIEALNDRGRSLLAMITPALQALDAVETFERSDDRLALTIKEPGRVFAEEERSRAPSVFSILRAITDFFHASEDDTIGLYGALGYDLAFQFEPVDLTIERPADQRDLVLFFVDELLVLDHYAVRAFRLSYDFAHGALDTEGLPREGDEEAFVAAEVDPPRGDHVPGEFARLVDKAKESFKRGDLFEVVPGQIFYERCVDSPAAIFRRLMQMNPAPFGFFINLGEAEYLVGASPEMFVRVTARRVETCPISGTIKRGADAIEDSEQILKLLMSKKDEAELTMCSDVDRNDKSRVCEPGSVRVIGRRQIEMYSRLIHTVDHIEGRLRAGMDAFDAFLSHAWAVTVTGAPKLWAMRFIEKHEKSPRAWYGGAVGGVLFNGDMNTGLTLRTIRIKDGVASVRAGATLLYDSDPDEEEAETELKASAMRAAIRGGASTNAAADESRLQVGQGKRILLIDHEDSFVHTLANYFRRTGAEVRTIRTVRMANSTALLGEALDDFDPHLVVMSPGPGNPSDFNCRETIAEIEERGLPMFGVCLGLQAIADAYGAKLDQLDEPKHGKPSRIRVTDAGRLFADMPETVTVGRYHSLFAVESTLKGGLKATARSEDGVVMAIEHESKPVAAVQFHPESIMSLGDDAGMRLIENVVSRLSRS